MKPDKVIAATIGFIVKSDSSFYEGLVATITSINYWHPTAPIRILDCGMKMEQINQLRNAGFTDIITPNLSDFCLPKEMHDYYTTAVFALLATTDHLFDITIHIDADAIILQPVDLLWQGMTVEQGIMAVKDYPQLNLDFQIGNKPGILEQVGLIIKNLDLSSPSFNGGMFALSKKYYFENMNATVKSLLPLHDRLWGNEMAILNLAAFAANSRQPFTVLDQIYNHRATYRRAPQLEPNSVEFFDERDTPVLRGHFGRIYILHFVGRDKPWHYKECNNASVDTWRYYRALAKSKYNF